MAKGQKVDGNDAPDKGFELALSPTHLLYRAQQLAANKSASALKEAGLTIRQFALLEALSEKDGASQSQLVDATAIDRSTLADMVSRMEKAGLIRRQRSESDMRANTVHLTDRGNEALSIARPAVARADKELMELLPKNRRTSFVGILSLIADVSDDALLDLAVETDDAGVKKKVKKKKKKNKDKDEPKGKKKSGKKKKD
jgi:DNA-binding MarR family transcriptional regulator